MTLKSGLSLETHTASTSSPAHVRPASGIMMSLAVNVTASLFRVSSIVGIRLHPPGAIFTADGYVLLFRSPDLGKAHTGRTRGSTHVRTFHKFETAHHSGSQAEDIIAKNVEPVVRVNYGTLEGGEIRSCLALIRARSLSVSSFSCSCSFSETSGTLPRSADNGSWPNRPLPSVQPTSSVTARMLPFAASLATRRAMTSAKVFPFRSPGNG